MLNCRKCRNNLKLDNAVVRENEDCSQLKTVYQESSFWYLDEENLPDWVLSAVEQADWTKGKLTCQKCGGKLGSFNFINILRCPCQHHTLPPVHVLQDRVDYISRRPAVKVNVPAREVTRSAQHSVLPPFDQQAALRGLAASGLSGVASKAYTNHLNETLPLHEEGAQNNSVSENEAEGTQNCRRQFNDLQTRTDQCLKEASSLPVDENAGIPECDNERNFGGQGNDIAKPSQEENTSSETLADADGDNDSETVEEDTGFVTALEHTNAFAVLYEDHCGLEEITETEEENNVEALFFQESIDLPPEVTCPVCLELYYKPRTCSPCQHVFCEPCLRDLCKQVPVSTPCPLCRKMINNCQLNSSLIEEIQATYLDQYQAREQELQKLKKTKPFYPLPGANNRLNRLHRRIDSTQPYQSLESRIEQSILSSLNDVLTRLVWLLILFLLHNVIFWICELIGITSYCTYTFHFNSFLKKMVLKLLNFGLLHLARKCLGLNFDRRDILGYVVVFAALSLIFMYDTETWTQFFYNMVILGSLFAN